MYYLFIYCIISFLLVYCHSTGINTSFLCNNSLLLNSSPPSILPKGLNNPKFINFHKHFVGLNIANNNNKSKEKTFSVNPKFPKMFALMKEKYEIENEQIIKEQKNLVDSLTFELNKILYKNDLSDENKQINEEVIKENDEEEIPTEKLNINDLKNIKIITKLMNKLTLWEQKKVNLPKAINLLISLHEVDRIIEEKNKLCERNLIYAKTKKLNTMNDIDEHFLKVINIEKKNNKEELFINGLKSIELIELGYNTIEYFELLMSVLPHLTTNEMKEIVKNMKEKSKESKKWVEIGIEYLSERMSANGGIIKVQE